MSDDEEDYMSDKFLLKCETVQDIRPGLIKSHSEKRTFQALKRKHEQDEVNRKKNPSMKLLEAEKRKEGLSKPIEENNKGFAMLQKMGYKPGNSIGIKNAGRTEPIPIQLKIDREGLGRGQMKMEMYKKQMQVLSKNTVSINEYRCRVTEKAMRRQNENDLRKSQRMCERLDTDNNIIEPTEKWYWFSSDVENSNNEELNCGDTPERMKNSLTETEAEYHSKILNVESDNIDIDLVNDENDEIASESLEPDEKLRILTSYLREKYNYCVWCSVKYNDEDDLKQECPGSTRDDH